jgi:branched-chain amino acid transport system permease protein
VKRKNGIIIRIIILIFLGLSFFVPFIIKNAFLLGILTIANIYAVFSGSWDILSGFTGKENFGYAVFAGTGAYFVGIISQSFAIPWWIGVPVGGLLAMGIGILVGFPTLRVKGPYFALVTLALASVAQDSVSIFSKITGGENGLAGIDFLSNSSITNYYITLIFTIVSIFLLFEFGMSKNGLILKSLKVDEKAAEALGVNAVRYKLIAFELSSLFAGMSGALLAYYYGYIGPDLIFPLSLNVIIMAVFGGTGMIIPAALGGYTLMIFSQYASSFLGSYNSLIYTGILLIIIMLLPNGIFKSFYKFFALKEGRHSNGEHH